MNNGETVKGLNLLGPAFQTVGYNTFQLNTLKVANATSGDVGTGTCGINTVDENGATVATYLWMSSVRKPNLTWGWYDGTTKLSDDVVFARGVGMLFTAQNDGDKLTSSGEVDLSAVSFGSTVKGLNIIANPYPVAVKINTLTVTSATDAEVTTGSCGINTVDENGATVDTYLWKSAGRKPNLTWGWYNGTTKLDDTVVIKPGQAILFTASNAGDKLIFPAQ